MKTVDCKVDEGNCKKRKRKWRKDLKKTNGYRQWIMKEYTVAQDKKVIGS